MKKFNVSITKSDIQTGTAQGNASLAGAVYGIYKGEALVDEYSTDANGQFVTKYYVCGDDWTIREITPSEGYLLDSTVYTVGAEPALYTVEHSTVPLEVVEKAVMGSIAITKHADDGNTQVETPEPDAQFEIYLKSAGSYADAKGSEKDFITTDESGFAQSKSLPYGIYTIHQTAGKEGYKFMNDFDVYIAEDGNVYRYIINNAVFKSFIRIVKTDSETGNVIPLAGSAFSIYDPDGNKVQMSVTYPETAVIDTFYTNDEGWLITPQGLKFGKGYSIEEIQAPYGYILNSERVYFDVSEGNSSDENGITVIEVTKSNAPQKGVIRVQKTGEVFASVTENNNVYQPVYEVQGLADARYEIRAAEDIYTPDGTLRTSQWEYIDTVETGTDGIGVSKELYLGKYQIAEVKTPDGMVVNPEVYEVELVYAGQDVELTLNETGFYNDRQKVEFNILKELETDDAYGVGNNGEILDVAFGLYASEAVTAADGTSIPAGGLIEIASADTNGNCVFTSDLPLGSYVIREISTHSAYFESWQEFPVVFSYGGQEIEKIHVTANDSVPVMNELFRGEISGIKVDENNLPLAGAIIGIFSSAEGPFNYETAIISVQSDENGEYRFTNVPAGTWYIAEIEAPLGYLLDENVYAVTVEKEMPVPMDAESELEMEEPPVSDDYDVVIRNTLIRGNVELTKFDADYPENTLSGAEFDVFKDINCNGELDIDDVLIGEMEELSDGVYRLNNLTYGSYFVKESIAPQGFILNEDAYPFEIFESGLTVTVETETGKGFINTAQKGCLRIEKRSEDGKLEGFTFKVEGTDTAGNMFRAEYTTNADGIIEINGLRTGVYTVTEIEDDSNKQYILPDSQTVEIHHAETDTLSFYNKLKPKTPVIYNTGDTTNPVMWLNLAMASLIGLVGMVAVKYVQRKKQKSDKYAQETDQLFDKWWTAYDDTDNE